MGGIGGLSVGSKGDLLWSLGGSLGELKESQGREPGRGWQREMAKQQQRTLKERVERRQNEKEIEKKGGK